MENERNEKAKDAWKGFPADLREAMIAVYLDEGECPVDRVIGRLCEEIGQVDRGDVAEALERIVWLDRFMRDCAMDFMGHPALYEENHEAIGDLLAEADGILDGLRRAGAVELRAYKDGVSDTDATALAQRINVYRCVFATLAGDIRGFDSRLHKALEDAKANVGHLLSRLDASRLVEKEDTTRYGFYLPGQRYFTEPLAMLAECAFCIGKTNYMTKAYHEYIKFLEKAGADSRGVRGKLLLDAEQILGDLFDGALDELYPEYPIDTSMSDAIRRLVSENPELPIVVFAGPEGRPGAYAEVASVGIIDFLDCDPPRTAPATLVTSREKLEFMVREECEMLGRLGEHGGCDSEKQMDGWVEEEMSKYEPLWSKAICIDVTWKEHHADFMF